MKHGGADEVSYDDLRQSADIRPISTSLNSLSNIYLKDYAIYEDEQSFKADLHDPEHIFKQDVIIDSESVGTEIPHIKSNLSIIDSEIENHIDWREDRSNLDESILTQSGIKDYIIREHANKEIVILVIIDGLSYERSKKIDEESSPIFVNGLSNTERGYTRAVYGDSNTSISAELVSRYKFKKSIGFAYWEKEDNDLTKKLNDSITRGDYHNIDTFSNILDRLENIGEEEKPCFVQVTWQGLDQLSHQKFGQPDIEGKLEKIKSNIAKLKEVASKKTDSYSIIVTSDHGILWKSDLKGKEKPSSREKYSRSMRYTKDIKSAPDEGIIIEDGGERYSVLPFPYKNRDWNNNEWGTHGGFSYYESIVPLMEYEG